MKKQKTFSIKLTINAEPDVETIEQAQNEVVILLEEVLKLIKEGYTSGIYPSWDLIINEN